MCEAAYDLRKQRTRTTTLMKRFPFDQSIYSRSEDTLYAYLPKQSSNIPKGRYLHESMLYLSLMEVIPSENGKVDPPDLDNNAIRCRSDIPNLCMLSLHIHEVDVIRAYWYANRGGCRFFANDMINVWPIYFIEKSFDKENGRRIRQSTERIIELLEENKDNIPLKDSNFDTFFKLNMNLPWDKDVTY